MGRGYINVRATGGAVKPLALERAEGFGVKVEAPS